MANWLREGSSMEENEQWEWRYKQTAGRAGRMAEKEEWTEYGWMNEMVQWVNWRRNMSRLPLTYTTHVTVVLTQWLTEHMAWSQGGRKQKTNPNHSKTKVQFSKQRPHSVSHSSCCWEARAQQQWRELVGYWSRGRGTVTGWRACICPHEAGYKAVQVCSVPGHT